MIVLQSVKGYKRFICRTNDAGRRLDRVIKKMLPDVPAGLIYSGIRKGLIRVNGKKSSQSYRTAEDDIIEIRETIQSGRTSPSASDSPAASAESGYDGNAALALDRITVLRTENLIIFNKPAGLLTHGPESLAELLKKGLTGVDQSLSFTPAPLHRLDRNTSGLLAVSLTIKGATGFSELMRKRQIKKYYIGLCLNSPPGRIRLENGLVRRGKKTCIEDTADSPAAVTTAEPLLKTKEFSLCLFQIETGLTHQIRSQAAEAGFPLAGDSKYGGRRDGIRNYILHSFALVLPEYNNLCGFKNVTAQLSVKNMEKLSKIFGRKAIDDAVAKVISQINQ